MSNPEILSDFFKNDEAKDAIVENKNVYLSKLDVLILMNRASLNAIKKIEQ